jgi:hypothetical protein
MKHAALIKTFKWMVILAATLSLLSGCAFLRRPSAEVPALTIAAPSPNGKKRMVIVLPGRSDDIKALQRSGIASVIQQNLPDADVVLVALTMSYYLEGRGMQRLHQQIVQPARQQGYHEIYLAGASLGGMGALMYESEFPNEMSGLILMAPYMGETSLVNVIIEAGGLSQWKADSLPTELKRENATPDEWRVVQSLATNRERARTVWLVCGQQDQFYGAAQLIAQVLPPANYFEPSGGHTWAVWRRGASQVFEQIGRSSSAALR